MFPRQPLTARSFHNSTHMKSASWQKRAQLERLTPLARFSGRSLRVMHNYYPTQVFYKFSLPYLGISHPIRHDQYTTPIRHDQYPTQVFYKISLPYLGISHPFGHCSFHSWNPVADMNDADFRPRSPTIAGLLSSYFCCCASDDERALLRPSWFQKVRRSNSRADSVDGDSQNWWRKGWNSVRRAGEWSESVIDDAGSCCSGPRWKHFVRRFKTDGKTICNSKPSRFQYDPLSYELNFDHGSRQDEDYQRKGLSLSAGKPGESAGAF